MRGDQPTILGEQEVCNRSERYLGMVSLLFKESGAQTSPRLLAGHKIIVIDLLPLQCNGGY